jgi:Tfp pilus assembly protein PilF
MTLMAAGAWVSPCAAQASVSSAPTGQRAEQAARLVAEGVTALERGDETAAIDLFKKALELNPDDVTAHTYLGVFADRAGNLAEAERHFSAAAINDPSSPAARNNYGAILLKLGRLPQAASQFEASLRLNKDQPSALVNLAQIRFSSGTPDDLRTARQLFERAYALAPDLELARAIIVAALRLKDREAAARYYPEYSARLAGADGPSTKAASRAELGSALFEAGLFKEAVAELDAAVSAEPSNTEAILRLAKSYLALDEPASAGRTLESALARGLDTAPVYALLASVYEKSGHVENAIPAMRLAIQRDPQSELYRFNYAMLLTNAMAPEAAVIRLKEALEAFPRSAHLWLALGIAHYKVGRNDEAAKALLHATELDPKAAPAYAYLGMTYVEVGQYEAAIKQYERALAINEKLGVVNYLIADALLKQATADTARVEALLLSAVKLEPTFAPARLALGKHYVRTNRFAEAASEFERVIKLDANIAEAYYQLGRVYTKLKRMSEAQATLATFKRLTDEQKEQEQKARGDIVRRLANVLF